MKTIELLAPAGSPEILRAVFAAGADAVYLGGDSFGARAYANNFTSAELCEAIDYAHLYGKKIHLTVNTLLKTNELEEQLYEYLLPFYEQGLDAVIVQDAGVYSFVKKNFPGMELHCSTQMTIAGAEGAGYWKEQGADRIVLARELSLGEIRWIHEQVDIPLECFAHGALCYCYSGQCLFSSMLGGRSGNRGRCAQPCRLPYRVGNAKKELYPLSLKDLCTIDLLPELAKVGVSSLKIEGRMKQLRYAAGVTAIYRKYLDLYESGANYAVAETDRRMLWSLGNRSGFTDGYLMGEKGRTMVSLDSPGHSADAELTLSLPEQKKRSIEGMLVCMQGAPLGLTLTDTQTAVSVYSEAGVIEPARQAPATREELEKVVRQTGDSAFDITQLHTELDANCFVPKQFLKQVRRQALAQLKEELLEPYRRTCQPKAEDKPKCDAFQFQEGDELPVRELFAACDTIEQLRVCGKKDYIVTLALQMQSYSGQELLETLEEAVALCRKTGKRLVLVGPSVFRRASVTAYENLWNCMEKIRESCQFAGFLAKNYDFLGFLLRMGVKREQILLDSSIYIFSKAAKDFFLAQGFGTLTMPLELQEKELAELSGAHCMLSVYGHAPFMVSSQCINRTMYGCDRTQKTLTLRDRYEKELPVKNYCGICCNMIFNAVPTVLFDKVDSRLWRAVERIKPQVLRMDFTVESVKETEQVLAAYECLVLGRGGTPGEFPFTRGHFKHGVE